MSESTHRKLTEAEELQGSPPGHRATSAAVAVVAVLAALATLFAHHRSISALTVKNQAILSQARASDAYNKYEAKQVRYQIAQVLLASDLPNNPKGRASLQSLADRERESSTALLAKAQALEASSEEDDRRSERVLKSYELLQFATTFFDIAIVIVSVSALMRARWFLGAGGALSIVGIVLFAVGLFGAPH